MFISEFDDENNVKNKDKWFMFTEDEQKLMEDYVTKRYGVHRTNYFYVTLS